MSKSAENFQTLLAVLYRGILHREPDEAGLAYWLNAMQEGTSLRAVAENLMQSEEAQNVKRAENAVVDPFASDAKVAELLLPHMREKLVIVDVGAQNLEQEQHVYHRLISLDIVKTIICFEPLVEKAKEREQSDPLACVHVAALGDGNEQSLNINNIDATSSILPINENVMGVTEHLDNLKTEKVVKLPTKKMDDIELPDRIDLLKLDIQGYEYNVLEHAFATLNRTLSIYCELEVQPIYKNQRLMGDVVSLLAQQEFQLHDLYNQVRLSSSNFRRAGMANSSSTLYWADGLFYKRKEYLRPQSLIRQAMLCHCLYSSFDKCFDNLRLADASQNTNLANRYLDIIRQ